MILRALYDYYQRCDNLPRLGMEYKQIGFVLVIDTNGKFLRIEDNRIDNYRDKDFLVHKHVNRSSNTAANHLYDSADYVIGFSLKATDRIQEHFDAFKQKTLDIATRHPESSQMKALAAFYSQSSDQIIEQVSADPLWLDITKSLSKKYAVFSFRIHGELQIVAEITDLLELNQDEQTQDSTFCLISGQHGQPVEITTATMIPGSQATAKLVSFQENSGYDSYGKSKCFNAPISLQAEFAYSTALNTMLGKDSHNKFLIGNRTFLFWASSKSESAIEAENSLFNFLGFVDRSADDPNARIEQVRKVFKAIFSGNLTTALDDRFFILGLAPNSARIAVVYWAELPLKEFAARILKHFDDMEVVDTRKDKKPYFGLQTMIANVTRGGKTSDASPNLPEAVAKSIFSGSQYPIQLLSACINRIHAEQNVSIGRAAIIKAYLNRLNNNCQKITPMLDTGNTNQGYLCGRLFAVLVKIQKDANNIESIAERYQSAASATPAAVFPTLLNLSTHHREKLSDGARIYYEKLIQEILDKISADGFPAHLDLQDQGRFFIGYYHQRQDLFTSKSDNTNPDNNNQINQ